MRFDTHTGEFVDEEKPSRRVNLAPALFLEIPEPATILHGKGKPAADLGNEDDIYIDTESWFFYLKGDSWGEGTSIVGPQGESIRGEKGDSIRGEVGAKGDRGAKGDKGDSIKGDPGSPGKDGKNGLNGKDGRDGTDGKPATELEMGKSTTHIQWRYKGTEKWHDLIRIPKARGGGGGGGGATVDSLNDILVAGSNISLTTSTATGKITVASTGGGGTPTAITVANEATDTTCFPLFVTAATGDLGAKSNINLTFNSSASILALTGTLNTTIATATVSATPSIEASALNGVDLVTWTPATDPGATSVFVTNRMRKTIVDVGTASITGAGVSHPVAGYDYMLMQGNTNTLDYAFVHESKFKKTGTGILNNLSFCKPAIDSIAGSIVNLTLFDGDMDLAGVTVTNPYLLRTTRTNLPIVTSSKIVGASGSEVVPSYVPGIQTGRYYYSRGFGSVGAFALTRSLLVASPPIFVPERTTFTKIGISCTIGVASTTVRLGLYKVGGGLPGTLLFDAGTVSTAASGEKSITISQSVEAGIYFPVAQAEGGASDPTIRGISFTEGELTAIYGYAAGNPGAGTNEDWIYIVHTGALAASFGAATRLQVGIVPAIWLVA